MNNIYVINSLFFGFSMLLLSILVILKRWDEFGRRWLYFSIFVTGWAIPNAFLIDNRTSYEFALLASRLSHASVAFIPATWLYFVCRFLDVERNKLFWIVWPVAWFLMLTATTPWFVPALSPAKGYLHITEAGPLFHLQTVNFFGVVCYGFYLMVESYLKEKSRYRRKEIFALAFATAVGFTGGATNFSLVYLRDKGVDLTLLLSLYPFLMAYAMIRERVLDVEKIADAFQREKLAAVGVLVASVNHEIKNPLYVIKGKAESFVSNWKEGIYGKDDPIQLVEKAVVTLETVSKQADRIYEITKSLMEFARPRADGYSTHADIEEIASRALAVAEPQLRANHITVERQIPADLPTLRTNPRELEEILFNLIVNACQAMKGGGQITIEAQALNRELGSKIRGSRLSAHGSMNRSTVEIRISDTGPGIPQDQLQRIFEPFYTTKESGSGLGLYVTKQLVERNGGRISVESRLNQGTRFILSFPLGNRQ